MRPITALTCFLLMLVGATGGTPCLGEEQQAPAAGQVARAAQLDLSGIESIASAGVPGPLVCVGKDARVLVVGRADGALAPVVASTRLGEGRVLALGHGGMMGGDALAHGGTRELLLRGVRWAIGERGEASLPVVAVVGNPRLRGLLREAGLDVREVEPGLAHLPEGTACVVMDAHAMDDESRAVLREHLARGGGLMTAGLGWGWLQLNPGKTIHEHPGNLLLREAGLCWGDGTLETQRRGEFVLGAVPAGLTVPEALDAASDAQGFTAQHAATLIAGVRVSRDGDETWRACAALLAKSGDDRVPTQKRPLNAKRSLARALVAIEHERSRDQPVASVRSHPAHTDFPGAVPAEAERVRESVALDLSVPDWHSTGLYAPAGEVVTIRVPSGVSNLRVRIGCHSDTNWHHASWTRSPEISRDWSLSPGENTIASAFGGLLYVVVPRGATGEARVEIDGCVRSPRYVHGVTTSEAWEHVRSATHSPAPWGEIASGKIIVSVPSDALRELQDPGTLMDFWDAISDAHATLGQISLQPARPHRFVADRQISAGYMHAGYPIMTHLDAVADMTSVERLRKGSWGLLHELGHNHQVSDWTFDGTGEVTCNLFSLHAIDTLCESEDRGHQALSQRGNLIEYLRAGAPFDVWKREPFLALFMYVQLQRDFGWETFKRVFAEYRDLPDGERPRGDAQRRDQWLVRFSRACGRNLGPYFDAWGVPVSAEAKASIAHLPVWMPNDWPTIEEIEEIEEIEAE